MDETDDHLSVEGRAGLRFGYGASKLWRHYQSISTFWTFAILSLILTLTFTLEVCCPCIAPWLVESPIMVPLTLRPANAPGAAKSSADTNGNIASNESMYMNGDVMMGEDEEVDR